MHLPVGQTLNSPCYTWHYPTLAWHREGEIYCEVSVVRKVDHVHRASHGGRIKWCAMGMPIACVREVHASALFHQAQRTLYTNLSTQDYIPQPSQRILYYSANLCHLGIRSSKCIISVAKSTASTSKLFCQLHGGSTLSLC